MCIMYVEKCFYDLGSHILKYLAITYIVLLINCTPSIAGGKKRSQKRKASSSLEQTYLYFARYKPEFEIEPVYSL